MQRILFKLNIAGRDLPETYSYNDHFLVYERTTDGDSTPTNPAVVFPTDDVIATKIKQG